MKALTVEQFLLIHSILITETGGTHGVRDIKMLSSISTEPFQKVFGKRLYPRIFEKAAVYAHRIIMRHPFIDGNKRSGITAAFMFLRQNGIEAKVPKGEIERFAVDIVTGKKEIKEISGWLEKYSRIISKK